MKIIIWGHPLHTHTHSYIHESFFKAFSFLGYDTYWFHDSSYPTNFDFNNSFFITEGFADKNIPINPTSTYLVMYPPNPSKYVEAKKFIELRLIAKNFKDHISDYSFNLEDCEKIGEYLYLEQLVNKNGVFSEKRKDSFTHDIIYTHWATNLLPHEFDISFVYKPRKILINFVGTISKKGINENYSNFKPFLKELRRNKINFYHYNPWKNPLSSYEAMKKVQESLIGIDIRGPLHIQQEIVTCRVLKNASYGHFSLTNSKAAYEAMDGLVGFAPNPEELLEIGLRNRFNYPAINKAMLFCKDNHTYVNRVKDIMKVVK